QFAARPILTGAVLGAVAVGGPSVVLLLAGWLRIEPSPPGDWGRAALATLAVLIPAALWEELLTRGYLFTILRDAVGARRAIVVTSVVFGLLHIENAGATWQSVTLVMLAGIFLGSILVATGSLYAAWAAHVAWNFVMAGVLHSTVSGIGMGAPNYRTVDAGPDWATGGAWGPEAGLLTGVGLLAGIYIMLRRRRRGAEQ
ncbi:MAG: CPBP family intramembrane metalloprotease, partial [Cytophagaceae bacterium]|nr:CPBP family intramembrane metalloprotease [Gemmatimonadaceae bacterium]